MVDLVQEAAGPCWLIDSQRAHLCWSPTWRSEVPEHQRVSHIGVIGASACIGWRLNPGTTPLLPGSKLLATLGDTPSREVVETALLAAGVQVRPANRLPPPAVPA